MHHPRIDDQPENQQITGAEGVTRVDFRDQRLMDVGIGLRLGVFGTLTPHRCARWPGAFLTDAIITRRPWAWSLSLPPASPRACCWLRGGGEHCPCGAPGR